MTTKKITTKTTTTRTTTTRTDNNNEDGQQQRGQQQRGKKQRGKQQRGKQQRGQQQRGQQQRGQQQQGQQKGGQQQWTLWQRRQRQLVQTTATGSDMPSALGLVLTRADFQIKKLDRSWYKSGPGGSIAGNDDACFLRNWDPEVPGNPPTWLFSKSRKWGRLHTACQPSTFLE